MLGCINSIYRMIFYIISSHFPLNLILFGFCIDFYDKIQFFFFLVGFPYIIVVEPLNKWKCFLLLVPVILSSTFILYQITYNELFINFNTISLSEECTTFMANNNYTTSLRYYSRV